MTAHNPPSQPGQPGDATPPAAGFGVPPGQGSTPDQGAGQPAGQGFGSAPSFGQPPAVPPQPGPGEPPPAGPPPPVGGAPAGSKPKRPIGVTIISVIVGVGVLLGVRFGLNALRNEDPPEVGDCLSGEVDPSDRDVVGCDSDEAVWSVIGADGAWVYSEFLSAPQEEICSSHEGWHEALWWGEQGDDDASGEVFCLVPAD